MFPSKFKVFLQTPKIARVRKLKVAVSTQLYLAGETENLNFHQPSPVCKNSLKGGKKNNNILLYRQNKIIYRPNLAFRLLAASAVKLSVICYFFLTSVFTFWGV